MGRWDARQMPGARADDEPDQAEADVELLPFDETDPGYLELRRDAQEQHYRHQIHLARKRADSPAATELEQARAVADVRDWTRLLEDLRRGDDFATGAGDRTLF